MHPSVFWDHQVRGVGSVHDVVVVQHYEAECLMKGGVVAEEQINQTAQSQMFKNNHDVNEERLR